MSSDPQNDKKPAPAAPGPALAAPPAQATGEDAPQSEAEPHRATVGEAFRTIRPGDFLAVHRAPCSRDGLLTGIGTGSAIGGVRYIVGGTVSKAANWAVASFFFASIASYEYCQAKRRQEKANMRRAVEVISHKNQEAKRQMEEEKKRQDEEAARIAAQRRWYKFW